jgi:hypothetical protein
MGNFDGRGDSLNLKSDKEWVLSFLISRIKRFSPLGGKVDMLIEEIQRLKYLHNADGILTSTRRSTLPIPEGT